MRFKDLEQGSEEWHSFRSTRIGASECAAVIGKSVKSAANVWRKKRGVAEPTIMSPAMRQGNEREPEARKYFSSKLGTVFVPKVCVPDDQDWQEASLDGWNGKIILEIKCPFSNKVFEDAVFGIFNPDYLWQVQHQMSVTGAESAILAFYRPEVELTGVEIQIDRSEEMIAELNEKEAFFYKEYMLEFREPPRGYGKPKRGNSLPFPKNIEV